MATYYEILSVDRQTAPEGVRLAYRRLAQKYHPDKLNGSADAVRVMAAINEAYRVLSDPARRASYDRHIEDALAHARRARLPLRTAQVPDAAWPWYLLFATAAFSAVAVATVAYKSVVPRVAATVAAPAQQPVSHTHSAAAPLQSTSR